MILPAGSRRARARAPRPIWVPHGGSQEIFLSCPVFEVLYEGTRGPGKTDALLMDFAQHVGQGWGLEWKGILFRQTYKQLKDVIDKSLKWFTQIFPGARYLRGEHEWHFPDGEQLLFRYLETPEDYWNYHGHAYPWIGFEELTNWPDLVAYNRMKSVCRSTAPGIPRKLRGTANPWGVGHNAVKMRFVDPAPAGTIVEELVEGRYLQRVRIKGHWSENRALMDAQPDYPSFIAASADSESQKKAWLQGSWDVVAGGMFDDVWSERNVKPHELFFDGHELRVPSSWRLDRAYDWGSAKPFSLGWWLEADGTEGPGGFTPPRGTLIRVAEWYGWDGRNPNVGLRMGDREIARGIREREEQMGVWGKVKPGPADSMIFALDNEGKSIAGSMAKERVRFTEADKRPGSRRTGWARVRDMMRAVRDEDREHPHMYIVDRCTQFRRTVPTLPRSQRDPDDVDTDAEDHVGDETRYRATAPRGGITTTTHEV